MHYLCLTVPARAGETEAAFRGRLTAFWTHLLRNHPLEYERVYSEAVEFEEHGGRLARQYMVEPAVVAFLNEQFAGKAFDAPHVDEAEEYTKAEASSSDWFQIDH